MLIGKKIFVTAAVVIVILLAVGGGIYWYGSHADYSIAKLSPVTLQPQTNIKLGSLVTAKVTLRTPWRRRPIAAQATVSQGCRLLAQPHISRQAVRLGYTLWNITAQFKPFRTGQMKPGKLVVTFNRDPRQEGNAPGKDMVMTLTIPGFSVSSLPLDNRAAPTIAGAIAPGSQTNGHAIYYWLGLAVAILLGLTLYIWLKRQRHESAVIVPPWEKALLRLNTLRHNMVAGEAKLEVCFAKLTDIVRLYLEERFQLPSSKQTTYEFLASLRKSSSPLQTEHREFLKEFMQAADLVKFAKLPPDQQQLGHAINKAETLIKETEPKPEEDSLK